MIFAATDFIQYLLREGPYSEGVFHLQGAFLATPDTASILDQVRDGDGIFCHPLNAFMSWIVMYVTGGPWSHVGILTNQGTVLEAITQGFVERPATCYFDGRHYVCIKRLNATDEQRRKVVSLGRQGVGIIKYDWLGAFRLGLVHIFGAHDGWQIRCSIDVVLLLSIFYFVARHSPLVRSVLALLAVAYIAVVFANRPLRRRMRAAQHKLQREPPFFGTTSG